MVLDPTLVHIDGELIDMSLDENNFALPQFIMELHKKNGDNYPSEMVYEIIICLQLFLNMHGQHFKLLDEEDCMIIRNTLDNHMKELAELGCVKPRNKACITVEEEMLPWQHGILGNSNPKQLVEMLLYLFGIHFALCAGAEHPSLRVGPNSQLKVKVDSSSTLRYLEYREDWSKNNQGGIGDIQKQRKVVRAYKNTKGPNKCALSFTFNIWMPDQLINVQRIFI